MSCLQVIGQTLHDAAVPILYTLTLGGLATVVLLEGRRRVRHEETLNAAARERETRRAERREYLVVQTADRFYAVTTSPSDPKKYDRAIERGGWDTLPMDSGNQLVRQMCAVGSLEEANALIELHKERQRELDRNRQSERKRP